MILLANIRNDTIYGGEGNDTIYAEDGNDKIYGGLGNDTLDGGKGYDEFYLLKMMEVILFILKEEIH
jgi:Ca2+-binding RTX toxin-like protein